MAKVRVNLSGPCSEPVSPSVKGGWKHPLKNPKGRVGKGRADLFQCELIFQGDANRSYSDEDQSSSNMEEFDKLPEGLDNSGGKHMFTFRSGSEAFHRSPDGHKAQWLPHET